MTDRLGIEYGLINNNFKFHSTCGVIHPAIEAVADALNYPLQRNEYPPFKPNGILDTNVIKRVKIFSGDTRILKLNFSPGYNQSAKFSLPFALAVYLVTGRASPDTINESYLYNDQVRSLEKRISLEFDIEFNNKLAEASIEFNDGQVLIGKCENILGRSVNPASRASIYNKFNALTDEVLSDNNKGKIWNAINSIEELIHVNEIFEI